MRSMSAVYSRSLNPDTYPERTGPIMKLNIHDSPANHAHAFKLAPVVTTTSGLGHGNLAQTLISLREEDPAFNKVIHVQHLERGSLVATPDDLSQKMYVLMNGKVNMIC